MTGASRARAANAVQNGSYLSKRVLVVLARFTTGILSLSLAVCIHSRPFYNTAKGS